MKGIYKIGIVVLLLLTITTASAVTEIGDNIIATWVNASFFNGDGSNIFNVQRSNIVGQVGIDDSQNVSINTKTTLAEANQSANLYNVNGSNITSGIIPTARYLDAVNSSAQISRSQVTGQTGVDDAQNTSINGKEPAITGGTNNQFWNGLKQWISLAAANISDFTASARSSISSSSGLVSYTSTTGVVSDSINSSANLYNVNGSNITSGIIPTARYLDAVNSSALLQSISQVLGLQGNLDTLNTTKANKTNIGEFTGGQLPDARIENASVWNNKTAEYTFWKTDATGVVINQGSNLPVALTELDSAVLGTRLNISDTEIGNKIACTINARALATAAITINVSVRDTSDTNNVLCFVTFPSTASTTFTKIGTYFTKPSWFTGEKQLAVYTGGGNGAADFLFKHVAVRHRD